MRNARISFFIIISTALHIFCHSAFSLEKPTHEALNEYISRNSINNFSLDTYLKHRLGILQGVVEKIYNGNRIFQWLAAGGKAEDEPDEFCRLMIKKGRALNHFHNPLVTWDKAGFDLSPFRGQSSILWAQNSNQDIGGKWSWHDARTYFYNGITFKDPPEKKKNFAYSFKALGQLMHLVQDASVPSHARDDFHFWDYELWLEKTRFNDDAVFKTFIKYPVGFKKEIFSESPNNLAPIPIAKLVDTDKYKGNNPDVTSSNEIGLAEYAGANFFSEHTIWGTQIPFPKLENATITPYKIPSPRDPSRMVTRPYYQKTADGDTGYRLATAGFLFNYITKYISGGNYLDNPGLDGGVYSDYAQRLIPRAIGYSAGLLEYFFRGNIEITLPEDGFYSMLEEKDQGRGFTKITLLARNTTPNDEEMPDGSIQLVVHYKVAQEDPFQSKPVAVSEDFSYIAVPEKKNLRSIPRDQGVLLEFDLTENPIPLYATDVYLQLVYKGKLGLEEGAVAVGFKDISEPTPIDIFNDMDRSCVNGVWYVAGSPEVIAMFDSNTDGIADLWDVYPHELSNTFIRFSRPDAYKPVTADDYHLKIDKMAPGAFLRMGYLLSDYDYSMSDAASAKPVHNDDWFWHTPYFLCPPDYYQHSPCLFQQKGRKNQTDWVTYSKEEECRVYNVTAPCTVNVRSYPSSDAFRGVNMWGGVILENAAYPPGVPAELGCLQ